MAGSFTHSSCSGFGRIAVKPDDDAAQTMRERADAWRVNEKCSRTKPAMPDTSKCMVNVMCNLKTGHPASCRFEPVGRTGTHHCQCTRPYVVVQYPVTVCNRCLRPPTP